MEKINKILSTLNILTNPEIDEITSSLFKYDYYFNDEKVLVINLSFKDGFNYSTIDKIYNFNNVQNKILIKLNFDFKLLSKEWKQIFISNFIADINNELLKKSLNRQALNLTDDNELIIDYITDQELDLWMNNEANLIKYINDNYGYFITKFIYKKNSTYDDYIKSVDDDFSKKITENNTIINSSVTNKKYSYNNSNYKKWSNLNVTKIIDIDNPMASYVISGQVFDIKKDQLKNGAYFISYYVTDFTSSIVLKKYVIDIESFKDDILVNDWISAYININIQNNDPSQFNGKIIDYKKIDPLYIPEIDTSDKKRVEFSIHTKMSAYDGIIDPKSLKETLLNWGMNTFAITDRYNVQAFPEIMHEFKKTPIKPIYGVEMEFLPKEIFAVLNPINQNLNDAEYIVFDIETTGLYPEFDEIIEFGATKLQNGIIVDRIQFFIKPNSPISAKTTEITGITQQDVDNAMDQISGLLKIKNFLSNAVLVAHNGINFDINFINKKLSQFGIEQINNTLIDTLLISRGYNVGYKSHTLESVCKKYKVEYNREEAHRADYDAVVLSYLWLELIKRFEQENITNINQINDFVNTESLYSSTIGNFALVYVKKQSGIRNLYELISYSHSDFLFGRPTIRIDDIKKFSDNLLLANSPIDSDVFYGSLSKSDNELMEIIDKYDVITVAPPSCFEHEIHARNITIENVKKAIKRIIDLSSKLKKTIIAVSTAYYIDSNDSQFYNLYVNNPVLNRKNHRYLKFGKHPDLHLRTTKQMLEEFAFLEDADLIEKIVIDNTIELSTLFDDVTPLQSKLFPPNIDGVNESVEKTVYENAHRIYGDSLPTIVEERINKELKSIISNGYAVVYWISHLLVEKSINDGYVVGSRGSVGSSLVATFLNITDVNPLQPHYICPHCKYSDFNIDIEKYSDGYDLPYINCPNCNQIMKGEGHNIPFETFLGFNGDKVPDIDLNFSGVYQPQAHKFIKDMFGSTHSFRAGTISTIAEKTSFENARAYFEKINKNVSKAEIERFAIKCQDVKRTTGQHPGGIIVVPKDMSIFDFTPYNYPADDKSQDWYTTHFAFEYIHDNLLKFDILGHDNPTILKILKDLTGVDEKDIPNNDPKTMSLFSSLDALGINSNDINGETTGALSLPEFGTPFVRGMLNQTKPKTFSDLIRISGLSHGTDVWIGNAHELIKQGYTLDQIIGCRDDIMVYLIQHGVDPLTSFQVMEDVRKGKKIKPEHQKILEDLNIPKWYIDSCNKIKYMFPKAHATAYVMHAWKFAWYKLNYPLEYYSAYFSIKPSVFNVKIMCEGHQSIKNEIERITKSLSNPKLKSTIKTKDKELFPLYEIALEMYSRGYKFEMIDINRSDATQFIVDHDNKSLICPFVALDGLGDQVAISIMEARKQKLFSSFDDFKNRTRVTKQHIELLSELGIFKEISDNDQLSLFDL